MTECWDPQWCLRTYYCYCRLGNTHGRLSIGVGDVVEDRCVVGSYNYNVKDKTSTPLTPSLFDSMNRFPVLTGADRRELRTVER